MPNSRAISQTLNCPECGVAFDASLWRIVDIAERPDLLELIKEEKIHQVTCPNGHTSSVDAPLLIYNPGEKPPIMFSPGRKTKREEDIRDASELTTMLNQSLGKEWRAEWLAQVPSIPRDYLAVVMSQGKAGARAFLAKYFLLDPNELATTIWEFVEAQTWNQSYRYLMDHPELLSDQANYLWAQLREAQRVQGAESMVRALDEHGELLQRCRKEGIEKVFAEKIMQAVSGEKSPFQDIVEALPQDKREELIALAMETPDQAEFQAALNARPGLRTAVDRVGQELRLLNRAIEQMVNAATWDKTRAAIEEHPELLDDKADALLTRMILAAQQAKDQETEEALAQNLVLLRRCRDIGVAQAFAELEQESETPTDAEA